MTKFARSAIAFAMGIVLLPVLLAGEASALVATEAVRRGDPDERTMLDAMLGYLY